MRQHLRAILVTTLVFSAGCSMDLAGTNAPVTVTFVTPAYPGPGATTLVANGTLIMDGVDTIAIPGDTLAGVQRGDHSLSALLDIAYLRTNLAGTISPAGSTQQVYVPLPRSCRLASLDNSWCGNNSAVRWAGHPHTYCPANDFGDFCSGYPDSYGLGLSWPADVADNQYLVQSRLLIGAVLGPDAPLGRSGDTLAMALYRGGDYSPRARLAPFSSDTSRWQGEVITDMRRVPLSTGTGPALNADDRAGDNFGLAVRTTYAQPAAMPNVLLVRFDVTNVSASDDYRRVHREDPAGGHTLYNVYLAPTLDPSIACGPAGCTTGEDRDDNATAFASDSLLVAYDQEFAVPEFGAGFSTAPGLLGLRVIDGPAGTSAKAVIFDAGTTPDFVTAQLEHATYRLLSGGRAGAVSGCSDHAPAALVCAPETRSDIRMAWSIGPIASLAPGQATQLTVAILFARPTNGQFTSGTSVAPQNASAQSFTDPTRPIYAIASQLRALSDSTRGLVVNPVPTP